VVATQVLAFPGRGYSYKHRLGTASYFPVAFFNLLPLFVQSNTRYEAAKII